MSGPYSTPAFIWQDRSRNFFVSSRDPVFMTTLDGRFVDFNDVALETLRYERNQREEALGKRVSDFYANPEEREAHAATVAAIGCCKEYPIDLRKQDGTIIHTLITTVARKDDQGKIIGFQGIIADSMSQLSPDATHSSKSRIQELE